MATRPHPVVDCILLRIAPLFLAGAMLGTGCASSPGKIRPTNTSVDLTRYTRCYVADAKTAARVVVPENVLSTTRERIASELREKRTFQEVLSQPSGSAPYLRVNTTYTQYEPGSRALRFLLIGLGSADLRMQVDLTDGQTGEQLATGSVREFWGMGGLAGVSRGIEDMQKTAIKNASNSIDKACRAKERA